MLSIKSTYHYCYSTKYGKAMDKLGQRWWSKRLVEASVVQMKRE